MAVLYNKKLKYDYNGETQEINLYKVPKNDSLLGAGIDAPSPSLRLDTKNAYSGFSINCNSVQPNESLPAAVKFDIAPTTMPVESVRVGTGAGADYDEGAKVSVDLGTFSESVPLYTSQNDLPSTDSPKISVVDGTSRLYMAATPLASIGATPPTGLSTKFNANVFIPNYGAAWLGTNDGAAWLGTNDGAAWLGTNDGAAWLGTVPVAGIALIVAGRTRGSWRRANVNGGDLSFANIDDVWPWSDIETVTIDGQTMVKIPKFYYKYGEIPEGQTYAGRKVRWVSPVKLPGYHIHPAFVKNGYVMDCFYIGAFEGYDAGSNKAGSAANQTPWVNIGGFENAKTYCKNRGEGWHLQNIYEIAAVNLPMMIELERSDVQFAIAEGNVSSSAAQATGATAAVWREIHEWWGNVWEHVDGLTTDANGIYQIFSNKMDGSYVSTGVTNPASGWITEMSEAKGTNFDLTDVFLPSATNGTEGNGTYGDDHWTGKGTVLFRSGSWAYGSRGGAFTFHVHDGASHSASDIGLRLAKDGNITDEIAYPD